jgi:hypothetical protein
MLRTLLYLILILATTASTSLAQDNSFPKDGLQQYAKIFDNCELSYTKKEASGETAVVGLFRSREGQSQVEFQYAGDTTRLYVSRRDASFLLDQKGVPSRNMDSQQTIAWIGQFSARFDGGSVWPRSFSSYVLNQR